jgi:hypothetical protein
MGMGEAEELSRLEETLWRADTRFDRGYMDSLLAPDFFEFGSSGRIYGRPDVLPVESASLDARLHGVEVRALGGDVWQVTYVSEVRSEAGVEHANRSSLWIRTRSGWKLSFHQGTPAER